MMFVHCPACADPVRQGRMFCTDCGADMPHPDLIAAWNATFPVPPPRRRLRTRAAGVAARLQFVRRTPRGVRRGDRVRHSDFSTLRV